MAQAALDDPRVFEPQGTVDLTVRRLCDIEGVGEWTAHYIALRAAREPDAFPASDLGLLRGASARMGTSSDPRSSRACRTVASLACLRGTAPLGSGLGVEDPIRGGTSCMSDIFLDHIATPIGGLALIADADGRLRALGWTDGHERMQRNLSVLQRSDLTRASNPAGLSAALRAYLLGIWRRSTACRLR